MTRLSLVVGALLIAACQRPPSPGASATDQNIDSAPLAASPDRPRKSAILQLHMRDHYADLRTIERHLVDGDLATVRDYAIALAYQPKDPELAPWASRLQRMRDAALRLGMADDVIEAARLGPVLAATCADCHLESGAVPIFGEVPLPGDDGTALARMARHQWAADRLWEAIVTPSKVAWRNGLDVLAATPLPERELTVVSMPSVRARIGELGRELQRLARHRMNAWTTTDRVTSYGEILQVCARCHELAQ